MRYVLSVLLVTVLAPPLAAEPVEWPVAEGGNGHFYEVFGGTDDQSPNLSWAEAAAQAEDMQYQGLAGHLATLTSAAEWYFVQFLPGFCEYVSGREVCGRLHLGGWLVVTAVIDPPPYNPPYVETTDPIWITGEAGTIVWPVARGDGPEGQILYYQWGYYSMDGIGYPDYGPHATDDPDHGSGYVVEYDGLPATYYPWPPGSVATVESRWGDLKALYR